MLIATAIFVVLYTVLIFRQIRGGRWRLSERHATIAKYFHYVLLAIIIPIAILHFRYGICLRGVWPERIIVIAALLTGIALLPMSGFKVLRIPERIYFTVMAFLPTLTGALLLVPFLGVLIVISVAGQLLPPTIVYYDDNFYRIQTSFKGALSAPEVNVYAKHGLYEKILNSNVPYMYHDSIAVYPYPDSIRITRFERNRGDSIKARTSYTVRNY